MYTSTNVLQLSTRFFEHQQNKGRSLELRASTVKGVKLEAERSGKWPMFSEPHLPPAGCQSIYDNPELQDALSSVICATQEASAARDELWREEIADVFGEKKAKMPHEL